MFGLARAHAVTPPLQIRILFVSKEEGRPTMRPLGWWATRWPLTDSGNNPQYATTTVSKIDEARPPILAVVARSSAFCGRLTRYT
jgi:hypothetical protein